MRRCVWSRDLMNEEAIDCVGPERKKKKKIDYAKLHIRPARSLRYSVLPFVILTSVGLPAHHQYTKFRSFSVLRKYVKNPSVCYLFAG
jgi:hypothetical protein